MGQTAAAPPAAPAREAATLVVLPRIEAVNPVAHHAGDFQVHVISGTFRKQPAVLTEHVLAREGEGWVIEYKLEDDDGARVLRVLSDDNGNVARVWVVKDGVDEPGTAADYDALMASASVVPDENEGLSGSQRGTCMVGPSELDCETKLYRVRLGDRDATLGITGSHAIAGLDLAGEITAADGTVLYRSVLVERGNDANPGEHGSVALADSAKP